jgi:chemotaxis protein CheD
MPIQVSETVEPGHMVVSNNLATVITIPNLSAGIAVVLYDTQHKMGGLAHIPLPDSQLELDDKWLASTPAKYADVAIPTLWEKFRALGAKPEMTWAKVVGGAQLFNFNGGAGNALNVGSRNLVAARTRLSQLGITLEKADTGGNRAKQLRFTLALGQLAIRKLGDKDEYLI